MPSAWKSWLGAFLVLLLVARPARADEGGEGASLKMLEVRSNLNPRRTANMMTLVDEFAENAEWKTDPELLMSYWKEERRLRDKSLGTFILGHFDQNGAPRGGSHVWTLLYRSPAVGGIQSLGPLEIQPPYSDTTEQKGRVVDMKLLGKRGDPRRVLWVELAEEESVYLSKVNDFRKTTTREGHAFRVGVDGSIECVAADVPLSVRVTVQGQEKSSSALKVSFEGTDVMKVEAASSSLPPELEKWVGTYDVSSKSSAPMKEAGRGG